MVITRAAPDLNTNNDLLPSPGQRFVATGLSHNCCELSYAQHLSWEEKKRVDRLLASDNKLRAAFDRYRAKQNRIDLIANAGFGELSAEAAAEFVNLCDSMLRDKIAAGMTLKEILLLVAKSGLGKHLGRVPQQRTLQLTSINHELRSDEFVYTQYRVLNF